MKYNFFLILLIVLITSCAPNNYKTVNVDPIFEKFSNNGFALLYNDKLYNDKIISKKMDIFANRCDDLLFDVACYKI